MKGVARRAAMSGRIAERPDDVAELDDRARPAMRQDQRECAGFRGTDVQEMDVRAIDGGRELRERVQPRLLGTPVVAAAPVGGQLLHIVQRDAILPTNAGQFIRPAGAGQDRKSTRLNSSHVEISYAVFCLKKKK